MFTKKGKTENVTILPPLRYFRHLFGHVGLFKAVLG